MARIISLTFTDTALTLFVLILLITLLLTLRLLSHIQHISELGGSIPGVTFRATVSFALGIFLCAMDSAFGLIPPSLGSFGLVLLRKLLGAVGKSCIIAALIFQHRLEIEDAKIVNDEEASRHPPIRPFILSATSELAEKQDNRQSRPLSIIPPRLSGERVTSMIGPPTPKIPRVRDARLSIAGVPIAPPSRIRISNSNDPRLSSPPIAFNRQTRRENVMSLIHPSDIEPVRASQESEGSKYSQDSKQSSSSAQSGLEQPSQQAQNQKNVKRKRNRLSKSRFSIAGLGGLSDKAIKSISAAEPGSPASPGLMMKDAGSDPFKASSPSPVARALARGSRLSFGVGPMSSSMGQVAGAAQAHVHGQRPVPRSPSLRGVDTSRTMTPFPVVLDASAVTEHEREPIAPPTGMARLSYADVDTDPEVDDVEKGELRFSKPKAISSPMSLAHGARAKRSNPNIRTPVSASPVSPTSGHPYPFPNPPFDPHVRTHVKHTSTSRFSTQTQLVQHQNFDPGFSFAAQYAPPNSTPRSTFFPHPSTARPPRGGNVYPNQRPRENQHSYPVAEMTPTTPTSATPMLIANRNRDRSRESMYSYASATMPYPSRSRESLVPPPPVPSRRGLPPGLFPPRPAPTIAVPPPPMPTLRPIAPALHSHPHPHSHARGASHPVPQTSNSRIRASSDPRQVPESRLGVARREERRAGGQEQQAKFRVTSAPITEFELDQRRRSSNVLPGAGYPSMIGSNIPPPVPHLPRDFEEFPSSPVRGPLRVVNVPDSYKPSPSPSPPHEHPRRMTPSLVIPASTAPAAPAAPTSSTLAASRPASAPHSASRPTSTTPQTHPQSRARARPHPNPLRVNVGDVFPQNAQSPSYPAASTPQAGRTRYAQPETPDSARSFLDMGSTRYSSSMIHERPQQSTPSTRPQRRAPRPLFIDTRARLDRV